MIRQLWGEEIVELLGAKSVVLSRRAFLGAVGLVGLAGCSDLTGINSNDYAARSTSKLLESGLFFIAHRGSGDNWTEHTLRSYREALAIGAAAIELSIHRTADGHFVCHHDPSLERLCGKDVRIENLTLAELDGYENNAKAWLGPETENEPIPTLSQVLDELAGKTILFVEDKTGKHAAELISVLNNSSAKTDSIVWKMEATGESRQLAADAGYQTWGYFAPQNFDQIERLAPQFDAIGIHDSADEMVIARAVATNKPVIVWEVHTRTQMRELHALRVAGMMCANLPYVTTAPVEREWFQDSFASGRRAAGDLPDVLTWKSQPAFLAEEGALRLSGERKSGYVLGSMASLHEGSWTLDVQLRWPVLGTETQIAGVAFGTADDSPYRAFEKSQVQGFHLQVESSGEISLWNSKPGGPLVLARKRLLNFQPNHWIPLRIEVKDTKIGVFLDGALLFTAGIPGSISAGYLNLLTLRPANQPVDFRGISLRQM